MLRGAVRWKWSIPVSLRSMAEIRVELDPCRSTLWENEHLASRDPAEAPWKRFRISQDEARKHWGSRVKERSVVVEQ